LWSIAVLRICHPTSPDAASVAIRAQDMYDMAIFGGYMRLVLWRPRPTKLIIVIGKIIYFEYLSSVRVDRCFVVVVENNNFLNQ